ncbi:hypothetical protein RN001_002215 [Aquatica leii]|uniref:Uncharacterized protein n=1 Tax=Aquatica leii TaxID=1421715 RepID=A0AAN7SLQ7_9COLE|nr:hypothetical protein RN001_002215 [Aquatica leii]
MQFQMIHVKRVNKLDLKLVTSTECAARLVSTDRAEEVADTSQLAEIDINVQHQIRKSLNEPVVKSDLDDDELNVTSNRNISNSDTETVTDTPYCNRDIASNTKTDDYVTRSGRISKKPKCFTEFVT